MKFDFDWVDAFTDTPFAGNGCAVVHGGASLSDEMCMSYVRETALVECTFTGPSDVADFQVRYFLASREIPFAGHPTVATVVALGARGLIGDGDLTLETQAGIIPVSIHNGQVSMMQIAPQFGPTVPVDLVAAVGGVAPDQILGNPQVVSTGLPFCVTVLKDRAALESVTLDLPALKAFATHLGQKDTDIMEPFWVTLNGASPAGDTYARLLLAPPSPPEDPFTGSATGAMAAYLWAHGYIERPDFVAEQGHLMGRPGRAEVHVAGARDAITGVQVSGKGAVLMSGTVAFPDH